MLLWCLQVEQLKQSNAEGKAAKKAEKKASKEAKKEKKRAATQMEAALAAKGVGPAIIDPQAPVRRHADSDYPYRHREPGTQHIRRHDSGPGWSYPADKRDQPGGRRDDSSQGYREDSSHVHKQRRLHSPERAEERDRHRHRDGDGQQAHAERGRDRDDRHRDGHADTKERHRDSVRDAANGRERRDTAQTDSRNGTKYGLSWGETAPSELQARDRYIAAVQNGHCSILYIRTSFSDSGSLCMLSCSGCISTHLGTAITPLRSTNNDKDAITARKLLQLSCMPWLTLCHSKTADRRIEPMHRQDAAAATRKRLDEAAKLKAEEERDKAAQRHQRQEYK